MEKALVLLVCLAVFLVGCSRDDETGSTTGTANAKQRPTKQAFDPTTNNNTKPSGAPSVKKTPANKKAKNRPAASKTPTTSPATRGREQGLAADIFKMEPGVARNLAMSQLMGKWVKRDPESALAFGETIKDDPDMKRAFYQGVGTYLAEHEPESLLEIISEGVYWEDQWIAERTALQRVAVTDFDAAIEFFANTEPSRQHGEEAREFTSRIAREQSTEAAFAYAERLQVPKGKPAAIRAAVAHWVEEDSIAASEYARDSTDPVLRDHAILGLADALWRTNPEDTIAWTGAIGDSDLRISTYSRLAKSWQQSGASETVQTLLASPDLSPTERAAIEEAIAPGN